MKALYIPVSAIIPVALKFGFYFWSLEECFCIKIYLYYHTIYRADIPIKMFWMLCLLTDLTWLIPGTGLIPGLLLQALGLNMSLNSRFIFSQTNFKLTYRISFQTNLLVEIHLKVKIGYKFKLTYRSKFHYKLISLQTMVEWIVFKTSKLVFPYSAISALLFPSPNSFFSFSSTGFFESIEWSFVSFLTFVVLFLVPENFWNHQY